MGLFSWATSDQVDALSRLFSAFALNVNNALADTKKEMRIAMASFEDKVAELSSAIDEVTNGWADKLEASEDARKELVQKLADAGLPDADLIVEQNTLHAGVMQELITKLRGAGTNVEQPVDPEPLPDVEQPLPDAGDAVDGGGDQEPVEVPGNGDASDGPVTDGEAPVEDAPVSDAPADEVPADGSAAATDDGSASGSDFR